MFVIYLQQIATNFMLHVIMIGKKVMSIMNLS